MYNGCDRYEMQFNGSRDADHGVYMYDYAAFSGAEKNYSTSAVIGGLGEIVGTTDYVSNATISCTFGVLSPDVMAVIRDVKRWLRGTGALVISDSPGIYYKVLKINYGDISRELRRFGQFSVDFVCTPYEYVTQGNEALDADLYSDGILHNPYDGCRPIYIITGTGACVLTVNGNTMNAQVENSITIDTEKMLAYRGETSQNSAVAGNYDELWLKSGDNSISVSSGFTLQIIPNWGWEM